jgi:glucose-1-phosphate thymidylyltransferase
VVLFHEKGKIKKNLKFMPEGFSMKAIILVAGYATRLYPLTKGRPKPLLPVGGKPMLNYIMEQIDRISEIDEVYLISNDKFAACFEEWAAGYKTDKKIVVVNDGTTSPETMLGAIGDIYFTVQKMGIDDECMIICGDNLFTYSLTEYMDFYKRVGGDCVCAKEIDDIEQLKAFAVATVDENNVITALVEKPAVPQSNLAVYGSYIYTKETMGLFEQYIAEGNNKDSPGNFPQWLYKRKPLYCFKFDGECFDIGTHKAYEEINRVIDELDFK